MLLQPVILSVSTAMITHAHNGHIIQAFEWINQHNIHGVQLNIAQKGLRPRELDQRARKDLMAKVARSSLMITGLDLMIPVDHWTSPDTQDRAANAFSVAVEMAHDLGKVPIALPLKVEHLPEDIETHILSGADGKGITLHLYSTDPVDTFKRWLNEKDMPTLAAGLDPAAILAENNMPHDAIASLGSHLKSCRLDDYDPARVATGSGRCEVGSGKLDIEALRIAADLSSSLKTIIIEPRELVDPLRATITAFDLWMNPR